MSGPSYPETAEGVALVLMEKVLDAEDKTGGKRNEKPRDYLFRLYMECLFAANVGERMGMGMAGATLH